MFYQGIEAAVELILEECKKQGKMDELKMYSGDLGYNGSDKNYLDFYDDGITSSYDYYPYFLAEQIYQTPTGSQEPGDFVTRPLYTVYNEPFCTNTNNLFFVRG